MTNLKTNIRDKFIWFDKRICRFKKSFDNFQTRRLKASTFKYKPFSSKQKQILTWWTENSPVKDKDGIIADGAIRAGKTMSMSLSFGLWGMHTFDKQNFLICGKTIGSLRRNVIFDWKRQMKAHGFSVTEQRANNLLIVTKGTVINYFYVFGGKDESSQSLIQGITAAGVFFDEVALMPQSFVDQATARCSVSGSKFWFNCNPKGPMHWFKLNWIDRISGLDPSAKFDEENPARNILYIHFQMDDNLSLSEETKQRYKGMYSGIFFQRFILGLWAVADGLIYSMFDKDKHTYSGEVTEVCRRYIAVDHGTVNPTVFLAIADDSKKIWIEKEFYYDSKKEKQGQKSDDEYLKDFQDFMTEWGQKPRYVIVDPAASNFKLILKKAGYKVKDAVNDVSPGIQKVSTLMSLLLLSVHESCINTISEFLSYVWDSKASEVGVEKPIKQHDHAMDALRYFVMTILRDRRFKIR